MPLWAARVRALPPARLPCPARAFAAPAGQVPALQCSTSTRQIEQSSVIWLLCNGVTAATWTRRWAAQFDIWPEQNRDAQCGGRRLVVPASAVRARDDEDSSPSAGSWTARAAKFLRAETFQLSDTIARRRLRAHAGDPKDPTQKPRDAGSPAGREGAAEPQAAAKPRLRRASTQSPQRRARGVPAQAGTAAAGAGGGPGSGASAGAPALGPDSGAAAHGGQAAPPAANGSANAPEGGGKGGREGCSDGGAQAAASQKAGDVTEGVTDGGGPLKALQVKVGHRGPGGAHKHWTPASWWRAQAGGTAWEDYEIRPKRLLPGSCPLLVFVNTKSGPQAGAALRRRFLRLLNPLQVTTTHHVTALVVFFGYCTSGHARTMPARHQRLSRICFLGCCAVLWTRVLF